MTWKRLGFGYEWWILELEFGAIFGNGYKAGFSLGVCDWGVGVGRSGERVGICWGDGGVGRMSGYWGEKIGKLRSKIG